ncbi:MAG: sporulation protein [Bacteroidota bacterium]
MIGRVKRYFGIEGVKVFLDAPEEVTTRKGRIEGEVSFASMNRQEVTEVRVRLIERYARGRGDNKKIDEYEMGSIFLKQKIQIEPEQESRLPFVLPFKKLRSEVDEFANRNFLFQGLASLAKSAYAAQSEYYIIAEAKVKGTALSPFIKKAIDIRG